MLNMNKQGYKKTKIGLIPEEWKLVQLKSIGKWFGGGTPSKSETKYWLNGNIPWATSQDIKGYCLNATTYSITNEAITESSTKIVPQNALLMVTRSGILRHTFPVVKASFPVAINQDIKALVVNNDSDPIFVQSFLIERNSHILNICAKVGTTVESIEYEWLKSYYIPLPPLPEQQKIAQILSTWDKGIMSCELLIKSLKQRKKGLMQQLLTGKTRLKGFSGEWKEVKLGDIATRLNAKNVELNDNVVTISAQRGFVKQEDFFNKRVASNTLSGYYLIKKGQFAYNKSYSNGYPMGAFKRLDTLDKAVVTTLYICFELKENVDSDFILDYFEGGLMVQNLMKIAHEGGRAHGLLNIALNDFFSLKMTIPSLQEQQAIAKILTTADEEIKVQEAYLAQLQDQKKGLMQQLLTGQKRVRT